MDLKKLYYYVICLVALFVLSWGLVDLSGATIGLVMTKGVNIALDQPGVLLSDKTSDQSLDLYYQKKMLYDRLTDSLARIVIAGIVFVYCRKKAAWLEG